VKLISRSPEETKEIGFRLGRTLKPGDVVCLYGEFGSGKTIMVKGIAESLGINERDITSASFVIIAEYPGRVPFYHIDLYRIEGENIGELGLREYLGGDGIAAIEWAEKAESEAPEGAIKINLKITGEKEREIELPSE